MLLNSNNTLVAKTSYRRANSCFVNPYHYYIHFYIYGKYFEVSQIYTCISQKERSELMKAFTLWKIRHCDEKREVRC